MKKPYYTRKDLIAISLSLFYSFVLIFVGMCLEGTYSFVSKKNPIAAMGKGLNFITIECGISGFICLVLVALYVAVFTAVFLYERRFAIVTNKKTYGIKMIITYVLSFLACGVISLGIGILIQKPLTWDNISLVLLYVGQSLILATIIYVVLFALFGGVIMFVVNFLLIDKPFKAFEDNTEIKVLEEDDPEVDITSSFDANIDGQAAPGAPGVGGAGGVGGSGGESVVRAAEELDDREKVFPALSTVDVDYDGFAIDHIESDQLTLEEICVKFRNYLAK